MDEACFQELYSDLASRLKSYLFSSCGDEDLADDILQECFYRILRIDVSGWHRNQIKVYLYKTAASQLADYWRRQKRDENWRHRAITDAPTQLSQNPEIVYDMVRLFQELGSRDQLLLWLAYVEGSTHREIASRMVLQERSVKVLLYRARKKLITILNNAGLSRG